jgi:hypothetical protein
LQVFWCAIPMAEATSPSQRDHTKFVMKKLPSPQAGPITDGRT